MVGLEERVAGRSNEKLQLPPVLPQIVETLEERLDQVPDPEIWINCVARTTLGMVNNRVKNMLMRRKIETRLQLFMDPLLSLKLK